MKSTTILALSVLMLIALCFCLGQYYWAKKGYRSKPYHILLLMLLRIDTALAHGAENINLALERIFKSYKYSAVRAEGVRRKEERLNSYKQQLKVETEGYGGKEKYNRKILK